MRAMAPYSYRAQSKNNMGSEFRPQTYNWKPKFQLLSEWQGVQSRLTVGGADIKLGLREVVEVRGQGWVGGAWPSHGAGSESVRVD